MKLDSEQQIDAFIDRIADRVVQKLAASKQLVSRDQLAKAASVSTRSIDRWRVDGRLPCVKTGRVVRFPLDEAIIAIRQMSTWTE